MKIYVIGTGGLGGYFGGMLAKHGSDVTFLARGAHLTALKEEGLLINSVASGNFKIQPAQLISTLDEIKEPDLIIYAVKTYSNQAIGKALRGKLKENTIVLTFQNDIDSDLEIQKVTGHQHVFPGIAYIISTKTKPGVIEQTGGPRKLFFGQRNNQANQELAKIAELFREAQIDATYLEDGVVAKLWEKYIFINAFSGFTAAYRKSIGPLRDDLFIWELYQKCMQETLRLAQSQGIQFEKDIVGQYLDFTKNMGSHGNSSLYHDVIHQGPNELEALNGTICRLGKEKGIEVTINQLLYTLIKHAN